MKITHLSKAFALDAWRAWHCRRCGQPCYSRADMRRHIWDVHTLRFGARRDG